MWSAVVVIVGSVVCAVLVIASAAVGFSFLLVPILVAESMLLCAVYLARRALEPDEVALEKQPAGYVASVVCLALLISSVTVGLSFLVLPIVVAELAFLGAVYLAGQALSPDGGVAAARQPGRHASAEAPWYARPKPVLYSRPVNPPPSLRERLYERHRLLRPPGSRGGRVKAPTALRRSDQPYRVSGSQRAG